MNNHVNPEDTLLKMADALGLGAADLIRLAAQADESIEAPTVAEFFDEVVESCSKKSLPTYRCHFQRLRTAHGDKRLDRVTTTELEKLRDEIMANAAAAKVERAMASGRALRSYELDAHGYGAGENAVRAFRFFFRTAVNSNKLATNPAMAVKVPKRPPAPERPLTVSELEEVALIWCTTGDDPELDTHLFEFHRKTGARREGALNLRLGELDKMRGAVSVTEKFGKVRDQPYDLAGLQRLEAFARSRGATKPSDHVFRSLRGTKISRKRYETIYDRLDAHTDWTERLDLGVHWIRHTTLDDVRVVAGSRVAAAYAGHNDASQGTIGLYNKVTFEELCAAFEAIFGPRFARPVRGGVTHAPDVPAGGRFGRRNGGRHGTGRGRSVIEVPEKPPARSGYTS